MPSRKQGRKRRASSDPKTHTSNGRGQPMKRAGGLKPSRKTRRQQEELIHRRLTTTTKTSKTNSLAKLEVLPVEILEQIFFQCLELNLPRASPHLARLLSQRAIYSALVLFAYYEADPSICDVETHLFLPAAYRGITSDERIRLQEGLLRCRWFTTDFFESCFPALSRLRMVECWHRERRGLIAALDRRLNRERSSASQVDHSAQGQNAIVFDPDIVLPRLNDEIQMEKYFHARIEDVHHTEEGEERSQDQSNSSHPVRVSNQAGYLSRILTTTSWHEQAAVDPVGQTIFRVRIFPDSILRGAPWTYQKIRLLQTLRQGLQFETDRHLVISPKGLFDGMASAIEEANEKALLVLLELHATVAKQPLPAGRSGIGYLSTRNLLPLKLFHLACKDLKVTMTSSRSRIMSLLLRGGLESVPPDDELLTRWAINASASSHSKSTIAMAQWLLKSMELAMAKNTLLCQYSYPSISFTEEIGYDCLGTPSGSRWSISHG